ncbi:MAG TPA: hypothetical protein PKO24_02590 [Methanomassiliicoccales archaeon]|nr:hypothetical protein [Euryarchaeota archaeon]HOE52503.1 hypothetical protein [Methanomassiliicoccales archaeon]HOO03676.1 hypothetical protein [Methanomassiliicoccales archaeon]HQM66886.1 hypothetical protein [Methanomassiliicoccales archaeon]HRR66425.1 hypothetical protein [Methanomassiliicoccales archaeon]
MWKSSFRVWFYVSVATALLVSAWTTDVYWLVLELGMIGAVLGRYPLFDQVEEPELQRPLTVFMVLPFTIYVLLYLLDLDGGLLLEALRTLITMMASLLLCLFLTLILVKRTELHMNYRFILGFATVASISLASFFAILSTTFAFLNGEAVTNDELMWELTGMMVFGIVSSLLFKRDMRRMDYVDLLVVQPKGERP